MLAILLSTLLTVPAHATVANGDLKNPTVAGHPFLALTTEESSLPQHSPEEIGRIEQSRADGVCSFFGSPAGRFISRHADAFEPSESFVRSPQAVVNYYESDQTWRASIVPDVAGFTFASIHCVGD